MLTKSTILSIKFDSFFLLFLDLVEVVKNQKTAAQDLISNPDLNDSDPKDLASKAIESSATNATPATNAFGYTAAKALTPIGKNVFSKGHGSE